MSEGRVGDLVLDHGKSFSTLCSFVLTRSSPILLLSLSINVGSDAGEVMPELICAQDINSQCSFVRFHVELPFFILNYLIFLNEGNLFYFSLVNIGCLLSVELLD